MVNPAGWDAIKLVLDHIGHLAGLPGFVDSDEHVKRYWLYIIFNQGADPSSVIEHLAKNGDHKYLVFHGILEAGHVWFNFLRTGLELLWELGAGSLATHHGFRVGNASDYLESGKNIHKTELFLMRCVAPALYKAALAQFHSEYENTFDKLTSEDFFKWLGDHQGDESFKNVAFLLMVVFPALYSVQAGQRNNDMPLYLYGCKVFAPFLFMMGKHHYGPSVLREWAMLGRSTKEVLLERYESFSPEGTFVSHPFLCSYHCKLTRLLQVNLSVLDSRKLTEKSRKHVSETQRCSGALLP